MSYFLPPGQRPYQGSRHKVPMCRTLEYEMGGITYRRVTVFGLDWSALKDLVTANGIAIQPEELPPPPSKWSMRTTWQRLEEYAPRAMDNRDGYWSPKEDRTVSLAYRSTPRPHAPLYFWRETQFGEKTRYFIDGFRVQPHEFASQARRYWQGKWEWEYDDDAVAAALARFAEEMEEDEE